MNIKSPAVIRCSILCSRTTSRSAVSKPRGDLSIQQQFSNVFEIVIRINVLFVFYICIKKKNYATDLKIQFVFQTKS